MYFLHRCARSRGLQAGRERELVPSLCVERRGLLEMLISCNEGACVLQSVARCLRVCLSERCLHECVGCLCSFVPLETARSPPFIVEGDDRSGTCVRCVVFYERRWYVRALQLVTVAVWSMERSCPWYSGATHRSRLVLCDVGAPVVAGVPSSVGGVLVAVCLTGTQCQGRVDAMAWVC